jgi:hypothetical protein
MHKKEKERFAKFEMSQQRWKHALKWSAYGISILNK